MSYWIWQRFLSWPRTDEAWFDIWRPQCGVKTRIHGDLYYIRTLYHIYYGNQGRLMNNMFLYKDVFIGYNERNTNPTTTICTNAGLYLHYQLIISNAIIPYITSKIEIKGS